MDGRKDRVPTSSTKLTYDDFLSFPDDGQRHELIDGEHYVTPSPATVHQRLVRELLVTLNAHLTATGTGEVFAAPFDVVLSYHDVVEPDLLVVLADQTEIVTDQHVRGAPALVVEILSPGTRRRDLGIKSRAYERCGVHEYWLVDPDQHAITIRRDETMAHDLEMPVRRGDVQRRGVVARLPLVHQRRIQREHLAHGLEVALGTCVKEAGRFPPCSATGELRS